MRFAATLCTALGFTVLSALPAAAQSGPARTYFGCNTFVCAYGEVTVGAPLDAFNTRPARYNVTVSFISFPGYLAANLLWPDGGETDIYYCCGSPGKPISFWVDTPHWGNPNSLPIPAFVVDPASGIPTYEAYLFRHGEIAAGLAITATPEPATLALVGGGVLLVGGIARRRRTA